MKVSPKGKSALLKQVQFQLDQEKSGVPRAGIEYMLMSWVVGLLENRDNPELKKILEEE